MPTFQIRVHPLRHRQNFIQRSILRRAAQLQRNEISNDPRIEGVKLDPLIGANDPNKPLLSKLLAVPALRARYLRYVHEIADRWLDCNKLGPLAQQYQALIAADVRADTRKLDSTESFLNGLTNDVPGSRPFGGGGVIGLKNFAEQRRTFLLNFAELNKPREEAQANR